MITHAFTDCETTGFDSHRNQIITLSSFVTDDQYNIIGEFHGRFRPEGKRSIVWSDDAEKVHGISYDEAMTFPTIEQEAERYHEFMKCHPHMNMVAHNMPYDRRMMRGTLSRTQYGIDIMGRFVSYEDTVKLLKDTGLISGKSRSLGLVCKELGIDHNHHDAKSDAFVLIEIHKRCYNFNDSHTPMGSLI